MCLAIASAIFRMMLGGENETLIIFTTVIKFNVIMMSCMGEIVMIKIDFYYDYQNNFVS